MFLEFLGVSCSYSHGHTLGHRLSQSKSYVPDTATENAKLGSQISKLHTQKNLQVPPRQKGAPAPTAPPFRTTRRGPRFSVLDGFLGALGPFPCQTCSRAFPGGRVRGLLRAGLALRSRHVLRCLLPALAAVRLPQLAQVFEHFQRDAFGHDL